MPRIIVTTDSSRLPRDTSVLLDESVQSVHLSTGHAAAQLIERLAWAIDDAESAQHVVPATRRPARSRQRLAGRSRGAVRG
jgi:hypothetical protein